MTIGDVMLLIALAYAIFLLFVLVLNLGKRTLRRVSLGFLALAISWILVAWSGLGVGYSEGVREGVLYKASVKGVFYKSVEMEMNLGAVSSGAATIWEFSSSNLSQAGDFVADIGKTCKVTYTQWLVQPAKLDTSYEPRKVSCE